MVAEHVKSREHVFFIWLRITLTMTVVSVIMSCDVLQQLLMTNLFRHHSQ